MQFLDQEGKVVYAAKDGKSVKVIPAMEWLAAMCSHLPNQGEQTVHYYGYYSNVSRGKRQHFVPIIPLTYKTVFLILFPQKRKFLSKKSTRTRLDGIFERNPERS
jgi:hypothetical protein